LTSALPFGSSFAFGLGAVSNVLGMIDPRCWVPRLAVRIVGGSPPPILSLSICHLEQRTEAERRLQEAVNSRKPAGSGERRLRSILRSVTHSTSMRGRCLLPPVGRLWRNRDRVDGIIDLAGRGALAR
jgi:hypothetical protein